LSRHVLNATCKEGVKSLGDNSMENNKEVLKDQVSEETDETLAVDEDVVEQPDHKSGSEEQVEDETSEVDDSGNQDKDEGSTKSKEDEASQDDDESDEDSELTKAIRKVRNEARNLRKRLREAEATIEELRSNSNDELVHERDELKKQLEDLKAEVRTDRTRSIVVEAAKKAGAIEPDAVAEMLM